MKLVKPRNGNSINMKTDLSELDFVHFFKMKKNYALERGLEFPTL